MTELRSRYIAFLELKNYSRKTITSYVHVIKKLQEFVGYSPVRLTQDAIRNYLLHLKRVKKLQLKTHSGEVIVWQIVFYFQSIHIYRLIAKWREVSFQLPFFSLLHSDSI